MIDEIVVSSQAYLKRIAITLPRSDVKCTVEKDRPNEAILKKAGENTTLITTATHGRSGLTCFLMGSSRP
jgi:hypothetical protein